MEALLLRADAGPKIGAGHVLRCLALAQNWQERGGRAVFASAVEAPALSARILGEGMESRALPTVPGSRADAEHTARLAQEVGAQFLVVDGYHFDTAYQECLKEAGLQVLWIDDEAHAAPYVADLVLNQNLHAEESLYRRRGSATRLLLGPRYALLRREFSRWRGFERQIPAQGRQLLITLGGGDPENQTLRVLKALDQIEGSELQVTVVVGGLSPHLQELRAWSESSRTPTELLHSVADMAELMASSDLAICAAGSTAWELAFMGLPAILLVTAQNQRPVAKALAAHGAAVTLGSSMDLSNHHLAAEVQRLAEDANFRRDLADRGQRLVDGEGAARVVSHLRGELLRLRPVALGDRRLLWEWANDPDVRAFAFNPQPIPWQDHVRWFDHKLAAPESLHFLALDQQEEPVGQVRFDVPENGTAEIHVAVARRFRGCGHGSTLLRLAAERFFRVTSATCIRALIQPRNKASIRAFEKAGFTFHGSVLVNHHEAHQYLLAKP